MMKLMAKTALKLRMFEQVPKMQEQWCPEHQKDMGRIFELLDDLVDKAVNSSHSSLSYQLLQESKADFIAEFLELAATYRKEVRA
jgi:uncharacterized protein Yka (UPF0111/DUF47 family)